MKIPFVDLSREANFLMEDLKHQTEEVLKSGLYINGPKVKEFEQSFAAYCNVKHAISIGNGSDGLTFIMKALNIGYGDTVICPANSFIASAWSIIAAGAKPIFCDVEEDMLISVSEIEKVNEELKQSGYLSNDYLTMRRLEIEHEILKNKNKVIFK